jgi:hypothetical protein
VFWTIDGVIAAFAARRFIEPVAATGQRRNDNEAEQDGHQLAHVKLLGW